MKTNLLLVIILLFNLISPVYSAENFREKHKLIIKLENNYQQKILQTENQIIKINIGNQKQNDFSWLLSLLYPGLGLFAQGKFNTGLLLFIPATIFLAIAGYIVWDTTFVNTYENTGAISFFPLVFLAIPFFIAYLVMSLLSVIDAAFSRRPNILKIRKKAQVFKSKK